MTRRYLDGTAVISVHLSQNLRVVIQDNVSPYSKNLLLATLLQNVGKIKLVQRHSSSPEINTKFVNPSLTYILLWLLLNVSSIPPHMSKLSLKDIILEDDNFTEECWKSFKFLSEIKKNIDCKKNICLYFCDEVLNLFTLQYPGIEFTTLFWSKSLDPTNAFKHRTIYSWGHLA